MRLLLGLILSLWAGMAAAQGVTTPGGVTVTFVGQPYEGGLQVGADYLPLGDWHSARPLQAVGALVLIELYSGGNACGAEYAWLDTRPVQVRLGESFGTCGEATSVTWDSETITVTMPSAQPGEDRVAFIYDGQQMRREVLGLRTRGPAPDAPREGWAALYPSDVLKDAAWQALWLDLMGPAALADAQRMIQVTTGFDVQGDWLVGPGCQPHACNTNFGAVALSLVDGRALVALSDGGAPVVLYGDPRGALPTGIARVFGLR